MKKDIFNSFKKISRIFNLFLKRRKLKIRFKNVRLGKGFLDGDIIIGENTYINSGYRIVTGDKSKILIGKYCAIGRNFSCASRTHSFIRPTADEFNERHERIEEDIFIGNYVWIGDNVVIKQGIMIDDFAIIGANSVVTKNVEAFEIVGGVPAKHIRFNTEHYQYDKLKKKYDESSSCN